MSSMNDRLRKAASKPKSKGSSKPELKGQEELVDKAIKMKNDLEDMTRQMEQLESELGSKAYEKYSEARKNGEYSSSIFAYGSKTNGAMVVYSDKFSNFPAEAEKELREKDANFDKHFVEARTLKVRKDAVDGKTIADKTIERLMDALGDDFERIFEVKVEIAARKGFAEMWEEVPESIREMAKQAKPSLRNVTEDRKVI